MCILLKRGFCYYIITHSSLKKREKDVGSVVILGKSEKSPEKILQKVFQHAYTAYTNYADMGLDLHQSQFIQPMSLPLKWRYQHPKHRCHKHRAIEFCKQKYFLDFLFSQIYNQAEALCDSGIRNRLKQSTNNTIGHPITLPSGTEDDGYASADLCPISMLFVRFEKE